MTLASNLPLRAILFDWGNTLIDFTSPTTGDASDFASLKALHAELESWGDEALSISSFAWQQFRETYVDVWAEQYGEIMATLREGTMYNLFVGILSKLAPRPDRDPWLSSSPLVIRMAERTDELLALETQLVAGAKETLQCLGSDYPLGVVSNLVSSTPVRLSLEMHGLARFLSVIVVSADVGYVKPSPVPFRQALDALGLRPEETLFVGDDPHTDMRGAKALGMRTILLRRLAVECPEADFAVDSLAEVVDVVASLAAVRPHGGRKG